MDFFLHHSGKKSRFTLHDENFTIQMLSAVCSLFLHEYIAQVLRHNYRKHSIEEFIPIQDQIEDIHNMHTYFSVDDCGWPSTCNDVRIEETLKQKAEQRVEQNQAPVDAAMDSGGWARSSAPSTPPSSSKKDIVKNVNSLGEIKNWLVESMNIILVNPSEAGKLFQRLVEKLIDENPNFSSLADFAAEDMVDFGAVSTRLRDLEAEQSAILGDLESIAPARRRPGRPFGAQNKPKSASKIEEEDGEDKGKLLTPEKPKRKRKVRTSDKAKEGEQDHCPDAEVPNTSEPSGDPFQEMEDVKEPNKCATIPLHTKCIVVEYAKQLKEAGNVSNIEKEVMLHFKKYFFSPESGRWKSGLLSKWTKIHGIYYIVVFVSNPKTK